MYSISLFLFVLLLSYCCSALQLPSPPSPKACVTLLGASKNPSLELTDHHHRRVVVVGGGVGGLAVAARIASSATTSCQVTLLEKNEQVGGRCGSFQTTIPNVGTFRHERGPSLLLLPDVYRGLFRDCCANNNGQAEDYGLEMIQCIPAYQVVFDDGDAIQVGFPRDRRQKPMVFSEAEQTSRAKMNAWEQDGATKWDEYMRATSAFLDCGLPNFIEERLDLLSFPAFLIEALRDYAKLWPLKPHSDVLDAIFSSEKMKALASFQDLYVGLEPYRNNELLGGGVLKSTAPAVFGLLAAIELHPTNKKSGVFAPKGGFQSVTNTFEQLAREMGVDIQCGKTVSRVTNEGVFVRDGKEEEESSSEFIPADLTIVNADFPYATKCLFSEKGNDEMGGDVAGEDKFDWDDSFSFSSGVIAFHWSLDMACRDLETHNVFLVAGSHAQAEASWQILRTNTGDVHEDVPFNFYVHRASQTDPTAAPEGCDSIMVLVPCRTLMRDADAANLPRAQAMELYRAQFSSDVVARAREAVLKRLGALSSLQDLSRHILEETVDTPATFAEQFHLAAGTPFALSHGFAQLSLTRPGPSSVPAGLANSVLCCGASTRPGNGVPLVLIGAKQVSQKALRKLAKQEEEKEATRIVSSQ